MSVWTIGARKIPVFCSGSYSSDLRSGIVQNREKEGTCLINIACLIEKLLNLVANRALGSWCIQGKGGDNIGF